MDGKQFGESGNLDHRATLFAQSGKRERLSQVSPVNEDLDQRSYTRGIKKRYAAQVQDEMRRRLRPQGLYEVVNRLKAEFAIQANHHPAAVGI